MTSSVLAFRQPHTAKQEKALVIIRAIDKAKPGKERKAIRKALKRYRKARKSA